jgi:CheY-like chemotaxis protein
MNNYGTILIADDNTAILTAMRYLLDSTFEKVLTTAKPDEILKIMAQQPIDIVLLDMNFTLGSTTETKDYSGCVRFASSTHKHPLCY